ncbi:MAG: asparaginase [Gaiellaceae bacterium]
MQPIVVEVRRGTVVEARHGVHAVLTDPSGEIVRAAGDPELVSFFRSSAKPIQALPLVRARGDLDDRDLAIASASHLAEPMHLEAVRALLAKAPASEDELECGGGILHNCSGKHAGMLALCRARGWPSEGYRLPEHPCQQAMQGAVEEALEGPPLATATDGCGVVTFAYPLHRLAYGFARFERLEGGDRIADAMRRHPELIRGPGSPDTRLMQLRPRWVAKGGAEGLLCAADGQGMGVALKAEDGSWRPLAPALAAFLEGPEELAVVEVENSRGERVGEVVAGL